MRPNAYFEKRFGGSDMIRLKFCRAAGTVTGSRRLIEINAQRILLACGMYQGKRAGAYERNRNFPFDPKSINARVPSPAHIDHPDKAANSPFCPNLHLREQGG
jgi:metallo-beta-lactamase family protein